MPASEPIVGIDLGTTNSLVAVAAYPRATDGPRILPDEQGRPLCPSAVRFEADGSTVIGYDARDRAVEFPLTTVVSVKRLMGRSAADAAADLKYLSYRVVEGPNRTARVEVPIAATGDTRGRAARGTAKTVSPQEVSSLILRRLKEQASASLGVEVRKAVVTVPAYFDDAQRQATRDSGRLAGLEVVRIVNEPTAAALAYGVGLGATKREQTIVVYDLGGGTFDVSVLRLTPGGAGGADAGEADAFEVLATAGDTHLGGDDFDHAIVQLFTDEIRQRWFADVASSSGGHPEPDNLFDPATRRALRDFAERTKIRLSEAESASVRIDIGGGDGVGRVYERTITRGEFETMIGPLVDRTIASCRRALKDAKRVMGEESPSCVVLVGGATRTPLVRRRVQEFFNLEPYTALDPDLVVALGAAVQGSVLSGATAGSLLLDVVPLSLGIETVGGAVAKLIMRNSGVPARASERFSTSKDGQTSIKLHVLQGEREMASDCRSLGEFHLRGIPPMPAGIPKLKVDFVVDANGILSVSAVEERSGKRAELQVVPSHGLTREEVERIEADSLTFAREDMERHRIVDLIANANLDLGWIQKQLNKHGSLLEPERRAELEARIRALRDMAERAGGDWTSVNANEFHAAKEALDAASVRLHEVAIAESLRGESGRLG